MGKILDTFLEAQDKLVIQSSDLSLDSIANMVKNLAIDIQPKYQRRERWDRTKQSALIESFLLNIPVPPIYLAEDEYGKYSVIDGKQRITAIFNFIEKGESLQGLENFKEIEGLSFNQLPSPLINALKIRPYIRVITLLKQSDQNLKYEVFTRLNTGGDRLLPQEIRNAIFEGTLNDSLIGLSRNEFLMQQLKSKAVTSKPYKEMIDVEYVLRFFTLREFWDKFPGNMSYAMDEFMRKHHKTINANDIMGMETLFQQCMDLCDIIWGKKAFKRPDGRDEIIQGIYDAQTVSLSFFVMTHKEVMVEKKELIKNAFDNAYQNDKEFQVSMRQFTSNIKQVQYRIKTMKNLVESILA
jgi:hypothetical protein